MKKTIRNWNIIIQKLKDKPFDLKDKEKFNITENQLRQLYLIANIYKLKDIMG